MSKRFEFDGPTLKRAIEATFQRRGTPLPKLDELFPASFAEDPMKQKQWEGFLRRNKLTVEPVGLPEVMEEIRRFVVPVLADAGAAKQWKTCKGWGKFHAY